MEILIVGTGDFGSLLAEYLSKGHSIHLFDLDRERARRLARRVRGSTLDSLEELETFDVVVVSVPISATPSVISTVSGGMREGSAIVEVSSVKSPVMPSLREALRRGLRVASIHPLFGPGIGDPSRGRAALIPVSNGESELRLASSILPFRYVVVSLEEHDRAMAWLALVHLILHSFLSSAEPWAEVIKALETTSLRWFLRLGISSLMQSESLTEDLMGQNPYFPEVLSEFTSSLGRDLGSLRRRARRWMDLLDLESSYRALYGDS